MATAASSFRTSRTPLSPQSVYCLALGHQLYRILADDRLEISRRKPELVEVCTRTVARLHGKAHGPKAAAAEPNSRSAASPLTDPRQSVMLSRTPRLGQQMQFNGLGRREFLSLLGGAATAWPLPAHAQRSSASRIGCLNAASPAQFLDAAFSEGLREAGFRCSSRPSSSWWPISRPRRRARHRAFAQAPRARRRGHRIRAGVG